MWHSFENGKTIGQFGSERGITIRDDEHADGARISLERDATSASYAITCGIYGWMVHTRFFGEKAKSEMEFDRMREEIGRIMAKIPLKSDPKVEERAEEVEESIRRFVKMFP